MTFFHWASLSLIIIGISHLIGHFGVAPHLHLTNNFTGMLPANVSEEELLRLMNDYHRVVGGTPLSMMDLLDGLSLSYSLFFLWLGAINLMLSGSIDAMPRRSRRVICLAQALAAATGVVVSSFYFFWLPVASFGIVVILFVLGAAERKSGGGNGA